MPAAVGADSTGHVFVADTVNCTIRKISPSGTVSTFAGLVGAVSSTDGTGTASRFGFPYGLAVDAADHVYVVDKIFGTVRKLTPEGVSSTLAGQNSVLLNGSVDGQGATARFNRPGGIAVDLQGNLYVADTTNHTIRKVTPDGNVTTVAGLGGVSGTTNATGTAARFNAPNDVAIDTEGNLYVADTNNHTIRRISTTGAVTTFAGLSGVVGSASGPGSSAQFNYPTGIAVDSRGMVFVADSTNSLIRRIDPSGLVTTIGGRVPLFVGECGDGTGAAARFSGPLDIAVDRHDALLIVDSASNRIIRGVLDAVPSISRQPQALPVTPGSRAVFTVAGTGGGLSYQWARNGTAIPGATTSTFTVPSAQAVNAGAYTVALTNSAGTTISRPAALTVITTTDVGRVSNLAIRSNAGTGGQTLIVGFALGGPGTSGTKPVLMRGIGPALGAFGLTGFLPDPKFELFSSATGALVNENDNWAGDSQVTAVSARVGAFAFPSAASRDAALYLPNFTTGSYTLQVSGAGSATGVALAEIYDASAAGTFTATTPRLVNVSARTQVGTEGDVLIAGFYIGGLTAKTVLIRAIGPTLTLFGVPGALGDPNLELFTGATKIDENDNWGGDRELANAFASVGAFPLSPSSRDAVLLVTLAPGSYTAQISGVGNTTGVALVEVYEVP
jgi:sugar lactone lactonase YvrE